MVRSFMLNYFLICATGSFLCLADIMSARLSSETGLTTKHTFSTINHHKHMRQCIFKLLYLINAILSFQYKHSQIFYSVIINIIHKQNTWKRKQYTSKI